MIAMAQLVRDTIEASGWTHNPARDPQTGEEYVALLRTLYEIGRRDLPLARLVEGHVDAIQIVCRHGTMQQIERLRELVAQGATLGVWNAGLPGEPLRLDGGRLTGGKNYASGAGVLSHALVTADVLDGVQLILLDLARTRPEMDRGWWQVTGMQRSETHRVRWDGVLTDEEDRIGIPNVYAQEPYFSGGALRFVAVHAGGIAGIFDRVRDHLVQTDRASDPFQAARLAELFALADGAGAVVRRAATRWFEEQGEARLARIAAARLAVTDAAERSIMIAREAVGLASQFVTHPLSAMLSDLAVYLRQPVPDAQRLRVGRAVEGGLLAPSL